MAKKAKTHKKQASENTRAPLERGLGRGWPEQAGHSGKELDTDLNARSYPNDPAMKDVPTNNSVLPPILLRHVSSG